MADDASSGGWSTIESDEAVFTSLIEQLGVQNVQVSEIMELEEDLIRVLSPVYGVIFLFRWQGSSSVSNSTPKDGTFDPSAVEDNGLFFAAQTIQNACGTQAVLSVLLNNDTTVDSPATLPAIELGPLLQDFKEFTTGFDAGLRGESLSNSEVIRTVHNSFAKSSPFVDESVRDPNAGTEDAFHFIAYTCHHGKLYELDGLQPYPISHGDCSAEEFPEKILSVILRRIEQYPGTEIRFNLMAVCQDLRIKAQEFNDVEMLTREHEKRARWGIENALRRHNFVGLTAEVLKGVVKMKIKDGTYDTWIEDAKKSAEKRMRDRQKYANA